MICSELAKSFLLLNNNCIISCPSVNLNILPGLRAKEGEGAEVGPTRRPIVQDARGQQFPEGPRQEQAARPEGETQVQPRHHYGHAVREGGRS